MTSRERVFRLHIVPPEGPPFEHASEGDALVVGRAAGCAFVRGIPFADDRTLLMARRLPAQSPDTIS